jgi:APA family basic amino acid/polyamine antiporter
MGAWVLGGVLTVLSAILYAELVAMIPAAGGPHAFLRAAYPPWWAFLRGWSMFLVSETASIVAVSLVFAEFSLLLLRAAGVPVPAGTELLLALGLIWGHTGLNLFGVGLGARVQEVLALLKLCALCGVAAACLLLPGVEDPMGSRLWTDKSGWGAVVSVFAALRYGFFAYSGWEGATYVAEEVRQPEKNLPRSLLLGLGSVMGVYLLVNTGYLLQLGADGVMSAGRAVAAGAMEHALGPRGAVALGLAVVLSTLGNVGTQVMVKARVWQAMARDGLFFRGVAVLHPVHQTPNRALLLQAGWATVLLLCASAGGRAYESVIDFFSFTSAVFNISVLWAVHRLRRLQPDRFRPYRAWGYPGTMYVAVGFYAAFALVTLWDAPLPSLLGVALTLTGWPAYRALQRGGQAPVAPPA